LLFKKERFEKYIRLIKQLSIAFLIQQSREKYIKNVIVNLFTKELKMLEKNEYKYNKKYYLKISAKNDLFENVIDKLKLNNNYNSIKSFLFSLILIKTINLISLF